jgi:PEP-CTERM motif
MEKTEMKSRLIFAAGLMAALSLGVTSAFASATGVVSLSHWQVTLTDLNLSDGIAPSVVFDLPSSGGNYALARANSFYPDYVEQQRSTGLALGGTASVSAQRGSVARATASVSGNPLAGTGLVTTSTFANAAAGLKPSSLALVGLNDGGNTTVGFVLSPYTSMNISATANISVSTTSAGALSNTVYEDVTARAFLALAQPGDSPDTRAENTSELFLYAFTGASNQSQSATLDVSVASGAGRYDGAFNGGILSFASSNFIAAPVPEPATVWMLLMGGAVVAVGARRRRAGARRS